MSASFSVQSSSGSYAIEIESSGFDRLLGSVSGAAMIADAFFQGNLLQKETQAIFLKAEETVKSLDAAPAIIEGLRKHGANRQTHLLAIGGGIIQDISAFIASVYMRGLSWTYMPTTVLGMVDSCIGGKSSINVGPYKNLVGTFHPPERVLIDPSLAKTLPADQVASGLIEAVKICFCRGADAFDRHLSFAPSTTMSTEALEGVILNSLQSKKWFIEIDEFDKKERLLLNFGHTFGHALEGASHFAVSHGIAVGLGIQCAIEYERRNGTEYNAAPRVRAMEEHVEAMVRSVEGLNLLLRQIAIEDVLNRFDSDKKHGPESYALILVNKGGAVHLKKVQKTEQARDAIRSAIQNVIGRYA